MRAVNGLGDHRLVTRTAGVTSPFHVKQHGIIPVANSRDLQGPYVRRRRFFRHATRMRKGPTSICLRRMSERSELHWPCSQANARSHGVLASWQRPSGR
jgi:hypothetical protein